MGTIIKNHIRQSEVNKDLVDLSINYYNSLPNDQKEEYINQLFDINKKKETLVGNDVKILQDSKKDIEKYNKQYSNDSLNTNSTGKD